MVVVRWERGTPRPVEALPCGSTSRISTFSPTAARAVPRLMAVVVLPTPPFWLATARTRTGDSNTREPFDLDDAPRRVAQAGDQLHLEPPLRARRGHLGLRVPALEKQGRSALAHIGVSIVQEAHQ